MDESEKNARIKQAIENCEEVGVGTLNVSDGQIFFFRKDKLEELIRACDDSGQGMASMFVKIPGKVN
jgi:phosphosulfolactate synthase (CoM biosynthesis protein A)